jgi:hypothetical protein
MSKSLENEPTSHPSTNLWFVNDIIATAVELVRLFSMLLLRAEFGFGLHQAWLNFNAQYGKHNMESAHANSRREPNS